LKDASQMDWPNLPSDPVPYSRSPMYTGPQLKLQPGELMAWLGLYTGLSPSELGPSHSFWAKPGRNITIHNRLHGAHLPVFLQEDDSHPTCTWFNNKFFSLCCVRNIRIGSSSHWPIVIFSLENLYSRSPLHPCQATISSNPSSSPTSSTPLTRFASPSSLTTTFPHTHHLHRHL
jgi:hypothetical protein